MNRLSQEIRTKIPDDLVPAVEALDKTLDDAHFRCGRVTEIFCYGLLHPGEKLEEIEQHKLALAQLKAIVGPILTATCNQHVRVGTSPAFFHALNQLYNDGVTVGAAHVFQELCEIGSAHADRLGMQHIQWAFDVTLELVKTYEYRPKLWIRAVCDPPDFDTDLNWDDRDEIVMGKTWCAPTLIVMRPSRAMLFDATRQWERADRETSKGWLNSFAEMFTIHIKAHIRRLADDKTIELAKQSKSVPAPLAETAPTHGVTATVNVKQEYRRREIEARNRRIRSEFKKLAKRRPNMSSVWYSEKLAESQSADGLNAETIRKIIRR